EYFAAINGPHPTYRGGGVQELLGAYERQTPINIGYLLPASTLRYEAMGQAQRVPTPSELELMREWVIQGMAEGALGISTGLDYIPGIFASAQEIAALCAPVAEAGGLYVTHMRGGYEANSEEGVEEVIQIAQEARIAAHISHFHAEPHIVKSLLRTARSQGVDMTFDAYPYTRGCTLVSMAILPPELINQPTDKVVGILTDPDQREHLRRTWFPQVEHNPSLGPNWPQMIVLGHVPHPDFAWAHGKTLAEGARENGQEIIDFTLDLLAACRLEVNAIMSVRYTRDVHHLGAIFQDEGHMGGSDGIFIGQHPHPRGYGSFARYLHQFVTSHNYWTWSQAVDHLSHNP
ncbi:MAG TPA: N-acyl-D-aspartate/D-glutamate deacylase, partial [Beutenbergiaceae bacterium]|nr:N-acyl-D-aspartate/D-glutamate deacylase [Beutenbergiaceae bacterium]